MPEPPLTGTRVLDVSGRAGAFATKLLADLGADVIKVEPPGGDRLRFLPPQHAGSAPPEAGLLFAYYHNNKRGITLDFSQAESLPVLAALASRADAVVASPFGERLSIAGFVESPPSLTWVPADVLTCFITPFGATGPRRAWRATPFTQFAASGLMYPVGPPEGPPVAMPGQQLFDEAGIWAAFLIQAVLLAPRQCRGQVIDHSVHEVALFKQLGQEQYGLRHRIKTRAVNFAVPPSGMWECADGRVDIAVHTPEQWDAFLASAGHPPELRDPLYRDRMMRMQLFDLLGELVAGVLARVSAAAFVAAGQAAGLPCSASQDGATFLRGEDVHARQFLIGSAGSVPIPGAAFVSCPPMTAFRRPAPTLGEHNDEVYLGELGWSRQDMESCHGLI